MFNMWRLMVVDSRRNNDLQQRQRSAMAANLSTSSMRTLICLIFLLMITIALTIAGTYQQLTNICVGVLVVTALLFVVYSVFVKVIFDRQEMLRNSATNQQVWTTVNNDSLYNFNHYDELFKAPPSYESVIRDPKYSCTCHLKEPPSYSSIVSTSVATTNESPSTSLNNINMYVEKSTKSHVAVLDVSNIVIDNEVHISRVV